MSLALVSLGSNLGDRAATLAAATERLAREPNIVVRARSRLVESRPAGGPAGQAPFLNGAVLLETTKSPHELAAVLHRIEEQLGRQRHVRWAARTIDLDLLLFDDAVIDTEDLLVPHPRMSFRRFVLEPACEIAAEMVHPNCGLTLAELLSHLDQSANLVAIASPSLRSRALNRGLASSVVDALASRALPARLLKAPVDLPQAVRRESARLLESAKETLAAWAASLDASRWPAAGWTVADFWWDELLAWAEAFLWPIHAETIDSLCENCRKNIVRPKLFVRLETRSKLGPAFDQSPVKYTDALERVCYRPGLPPALRVFAARAAFEIVGAIEAMQPLA
ncbi:MAG: 2-amino-4-hydroxy-6-hydroxymethyldihydropteridine diphosphokinase [Planctomycetia bacterium]|nr:2-amino-4-hydroxy-6-hydroxymethyldihydropteridine diphosphokinase [Planctomycetia bacterium]